MVGCIQTGTLAGKLNEKPSFHSFVMVGALLVSQLLVASLSC
jgi:hypothetical protein